MSSDAVQGNAPTPATVPGHPPGLYLLFIVEMWERFSYYGMRALLVLYLITTMTHASNPGRGWSEASAYVLYGWYTGLAYLLPLLGGYLADKFLGTHRSMVIGGVAIALGHIVLGLTGLESLKETELGMTVFVGGLILIVIGTGFFKPCVSVMVGQLYPAGDPRRDGAFTIFYMGINVGAFLSALVCGTLGESVGWHWGFGSAAVGMLAGLAVYLAMRPKYLHDIGLPPAGRANWSFPFFLGILAVAAAFTFLYHEGVFGLFAQFFRDRFADPFQRYAILGGVTALIVGSISWFVSIQQPGEKGPTFSIFLFMVFNAFFWIAFEQAGSTLNVFAQESTDRTLFTAEAMPGVFREIPATWFQSINALLIVLCAPLFSIIWSALAARGRNPSQPVKIALGLIFLGIGYVAMVWAAKLNFDTGAKVGMFWLTFAYATHTLGELCLSPTGLSYVTKAAPVRFVSLLMGIWFISSFMANLGGGIIASYVKDIEQGTVDLPWYSWFKLGGRADFFLLFVISSFVPALLILVFTPLLKKLLPKEEAAG